MRNILITAAAAAAAAALVITPAAASASPVNATEFSETVAHEDLDLTTSEGVARLDERVRTRIRQLCRTGSRDSASLRLERECQIGALAQAQSEVRLAVAEANANRARFAATTSTAEGAATPGA